MWIALTIVVLYLVAWVVAGVRHVGESQRLSACSHSVSALARCYADAVTEQRFDPTLHGSAQILSWMGPSERGAERWYFCEGDWDVALPETPEELRAYHPADSAALRAARGLGSYAVRDFEKFPIDPNVDERQAILCDRQGDDGRTDHHRQTIVVGFTDGSAQKMSSEELGLPKGEPIVVGPDSPSPLLRVFERP